MNVRGLTSVEAFVRRWYRLLLLLTVIALQILTYFSLYYPRGSSTDYDDAVIMLAIGIGILLLIIFFRRSIEKASVRVPMQIGWSIILLEVVHTGLIQLVELNNPIQEGILNTFIQIVHDNTATILGAGLIPVLIGIYAWVSDISAREKRFFSVISAMPVGVAVIDLFGHVSLFNDRLLEILNLERDMMQDANLWNLLKTDFEHFKEKASSSLDTPVELDVTLESDSVAKKYLSVVIVVHKDKDKRLANYIVVVSDITARRRTEEEREQQRRVTSLYASLLTHDVGNDLQAVLGYVEAAELSLEKNIENTKAMLMSAEAAGQRMSNLIKTFKIESVPAHIEVVPMLITTAKQAEVANRGLKVHLEISPGTEHLRSPGGSLLPTAIENILRNAAKHASDQPEVFIQVVKEEETLVILINDNGPGISPNIQDTIFRRGDPRRENGLGLYLTKQIITACGGTIELNKGPESRGASYRIELPLIE